MERKEKWFIMVLIGVGIAGIIYSISLPLMGPTALSPGLFPGFVTLLMVVLGGIRLFWLVHRKPEIIDDTGEVEDENNKSRSVFIVMGLFLVYLLMLSYIHFLASTIIFLFGSMLFLYKKFYWKIPIISLLTAVGVFYLFRYLLNVRLP